MDRVVADDPVIARRERIARFAARGKRIGYLALAIALVAFFIGVATSFPSWTVAVTIAGLAVSSVVLPIPIVLAYGVRAAAREDRERGI
jgi:heme/copper-type cytochrome/quinol oxidase subunit 4